MTQESSIEVLRLDHYGIVAGTIKELGLIDLIDDVLGTDKREEVSTGEAVAAMIINGLGFTSQPLSLTERFFHKKPLELLFGRSNINSSFFNRNKLSKTLDKLFEYGCEKLFHQIAIQSCEHAGIDLKCNSLDTTSLSVTGEYDIDSDENAITLTHGHSKDHRPDLKQCVHELLVSQDGGVPLMMKTHDGNSSDSKLFAARTEMLIENFKTSKFPRYLVADGKLYCSKNSENLNKINFITRISSTLNVVKEFIKKAFKDDNWMPLNMKDKYYPVITEHYGISQRWLIVSSIDSECRAKKQTRKRVSREYEAYKKKLKEFSTYTFDNPEEALLNLNKLCDKLNFHTLSEYKVLKNKASDKIKYQIQGTLSKVASKVQEAINHASCYVIGTNIKENIENDQAIIKLYKNQNIAIENMGFKFLKEPKFFTQSFFIKKPERIEAMLFIMTLSLLVYSIAQRKLRMELVDADETLPNQIKKPIQNPTLKWVFQMMEDINVLYVCVNNKIEVVIEGYTWLKQKIISFFGKHVQNIYSSQLSYLP